MTNKRGLLIGFGGIGGSFFSWGLKTVGARAVNELGWEFRDYGWESGGAAGREAKSWDGPVVLIWHSAGKAGADNFCEAFGRRVDMAFAVDSWLPGQSPHELIRRVYSIIAGRGGRFHVLGNSVVDWILYPDETHTSIDDEPKLHNFVIKKLGELMNVQVPAPVQPEQIVNWVGNKFDRKVFFDAVRISVFGGHLAQSQVDGLERLLGVWEQYYRDWDMRELAYDLGTTAHETALTMMPIYERGEISYFDKYEPGTRRGNLLGNTIVGDGYLFRGGGDVQNTGRGNAARATNRLNDAYDLNVDLVANPEMRIDPIVSAHSLFLGNHEGWWTGKKLPNYAGYGYWHMKNARRVVNGTDRWELVGEFAGKFLDALKLAAVETTTTIIPVPVDPVPPVPTSPTAPTIPILPNSGITLDALRQFPSSDLRRAIIASADTIKLATIILDERDNSPAAFLPPQSEGIDMNFTKTKSIFKSKRMWGLAITVLGVFFPAANPIFDLFVPQITDLTPVQIEQSAAIEAAIKQIVSAIGVIIAGYGSYVAKDKLTILPEKPATT